MTTSSLPDNGSNSDTHDLSILKLSPKHDQQVFRRAFIQSTTSLFVIVCGACAFLVYLILEPFIHSILWAILTGALLFPIKHRLTSLTLRYLQQLDTNSHLVSYGLVILLPLRIFDKTIESIGPICIQNYKSLLFTSIFLPSIEFLRSDIVYEWITTIGAFLICCGYLIDQKVNQSSSSQVNQHQQTILIRTCNCFNHFRTYLHMKRTKTILSSSSSSTTYFNFVLWSFMAIKVYQFYWYLIPISIFVVTYKSIKYLLLNLYIYLRRQVCSQDLIQRFIQFWKIRREVLLPAPLNGLIRFFLKGDKKINHLLQGSVDYLISAGIIVTLFIFILFGTILLIIQIQHEGLQMINLVSNFLNESTVVQHIVPGKEHVSHLMDTAVNKFYIAGRLWITTQVAKIQPPQLEPQCCFPLGVTFGEAPCMHTQIRGAGSLSNKNLEEQILQLWDRLYTYITNTSTILPSHKNRSRIVQSSSDHTFVIPNLFSYVQTNFQLHINDFIRLIRDNLDLFHTIWLNATPLLSGLSTTISLLYTGGFALLNFFLSFIVFITLLFYLLSNSDQFIYRPTQWLNNILAIGGSGLGQAVNDVVTSVFIASLKIASFYGLYTYILHTLVGSNLVFLPAVIAAICAVMLKSYWAALPGCLDLWLVQQRPFGALLLLIAQIIPVYIVDTAIYSEVKGGGHQYLTALAIAGGVYYRGIEGAFSGPIILCCLLVGIRMYNETIATVSSTYVKNRLTH
ncbi:unnamed protein product [Adineta ricciae]|uniref:Transmembrane protein n=1 Tax=Adineta ricciae TaxID=249248 RepID=A0A814UWW5_ADIRI|nr:unnamed protein product [Adineta ricciae]